MNDLKLKYKLILMFLLTGLIPIVILTVGSQIKTLDLIKTDAIEENQLFYELKRDTINQYFHERERDGVFLSELPEIHNALDTFSKTNENSPEWRQAYNNLEHVFGTYVREFGFPDVFLTDANGTIMISYNNADDINGVDLSVRDYIQISKTGEQNWSDIFYSNFIDRYCLVLSTPIFDRSNRVIGAINMIVEMSDLDFLAHTVIDSIGETANAYIIDENGMLLTNTVHGEFQENGAMEAVLETAIVEILATPINEGDTSFQFGDIYTTFNGNEVLGSAGVLRLGNMYGALIVEVDEREALQGFYEMRLWSFVFLGFVILFGVVFGAYFSAKINNPLQVVMKQSKRIASLDITNEIPDHLTKRKDEIGDLASSLQTITNSLKEIIEQINVTSGQVRESSSTLTNISNQSFQAFNEISQTIDEIATSTSEQAIQTENGATKASSLGDVIESNQELIEKLNVSSESVRNVVTEGLREIENLTKTAEESSQATEEVQEKITKTNESAKKIDEASTIIASIADQTNLLALNAAIEAARAGEAGKGFAVVADEIRKLAEQSTASTKTIDTVIKEVQQNSNEAVAVMSKVLSVLAEQVKDIKNSGEKYLNIEKTTQTMDEIVEKLNSSSKNLYVMKQEITDTLQNLSAIAEENSAATEEVAASTEEQSHSQKDVKEACGHLEKLVNQLNELISKFKV